MDVAIAVYDINNLKTFDNIKVWLNNMIFG